MMFGVVLWSDKTDQKAVIWCEDHGDLAFYSGEGPSAFEALSLDPGDYVEFELNEDRNVRMARGPQVIARNQFEGLAESLNARPEAARQGAGAAPRRKTGRVIPFALPGGAASLAS